HSYTNLGVWQLAQSLLSALVGGHPEGVAQGRSVGYVLRRLEGNSPVRVGGFESAGNERFAGSSPRELHFTFGPAPGSPRSHAEFAPRAHQWRLVQLSLRTVRSEAPLHWRIRIDGGVHILEKH